MIAFILLLSVLAEILIMICGDLNPHVILLSRIPWNATKNQIIEYFHENRCTILQENIHFIIGQKKDDSNNAFIQLKSKDDYKKASALKKIQMFQSSVRGELIELKKSIFKHPIVTYLYHLKFRAETLRIFSIWWGNGIIQLSSVYCGLKCQRIWVNPKWRIFFLVSLSFVKSQYIIGTERLCVF